MSKQEKSNNGFFKLPTEKPACETNTTIDDPVNRTISTRATEEFKKWKKHDDNTEFCDIEDENDDQLVFIDLLKVSCRTLKKTFFIQGFIN